MQTDTLSATLSALADPTRRAILARLADGQATVNELAAPFDISLPAVSRHLKVLEGAGLISRGRTAQWRPCRLEPEPLQAVDHMLEHYRRFWEGGFDKMARYLTELKTAEPSDAGGENAPQNTAQENTAQKNTPQKNADGEDDAG